MLSQKVNLQQRQWASSVISLALLPLTPLFYLLTILRLRLLTVLADLVNLLQGSSKRRTANTFLHGNFSPVKDEVHEQDLHVDGRLPPALDGVFVRCG